MSYLDTIFLMLLCMCDAIFFFCHSGGSNGQALFKCLIIRNDPWGLIPIVCQVGLTYFFRRKGLGMAHNATKPSPEVYTKNITYKPLIHTHMHNTLKYRINKLSIRSIYYMISQSPTHPVLIPTSHFFHSSIKIVNSADSKRQRDRQMVKRMKQNEKKLDSYGHQ